MSLVMHLYYTGKEGSALRFAKEMEESGVAAEIRSEDGNVKYEYYPSLSNPETVLLIDEWRDQEALDIHHASPAMGKIMALREKYDLHMKAERLVTDEEGLPGKDQAFIRK